MPNVRLYYAIQCFCNKIGMPNDIAKIWGKYFFLSNILFECISHFWEYQSLFGKSNKFLFIYKYQKYKFISLISLTHYY